jgi:hypothetical protein
MATKTEICNLAISHLGGRTLTDVDTDTSQQALSCRKWFTTAAQEFLRSHPWNFAVARKRQTITYASLSGSALADNGSGEFRVTATAHGLVNGDRILLSEVEGVEVNANWYVTRINDNNFDLDDSTYAAGYTASTGKFVKVPQFDWAFEHALPTNTLRILKINGESGGYKDDSDDYSLEGTKILCQDETINITYIVDKTASPSDWPGDIVNCFSFLLASYIAQDLTGPAGQAQAMRGMFEQTIAPLTRSRDARESKKPRTLPFPDSQLIQARFGAIQTA